MVLGSLSKNTMRMIRFKDSLDAYLAKVSKLHKIELGEMFINRDSVVFSLDKQHKDFFDNAVKSINAFKYANSKMKDEFSKYLPSIVKTFEEDNKLVMIVKKNEDLILLKDVFDFFKGKMDPKHVAWILSSLHNLVCYFNYSKFSHNDIAMNTYFISPALHDGALLGGWWYATEFGKKMIGVPGRTYNLLSSSAKNNKGGDIRTDLDLIRAVGRELLGDPEGVDVEAPDAMKDWLRCETTGDALKDYSTWMNDVITASFGGRFFTKMDLDSSEIYTGGT